MRMFITTKNKYLSNDIKIFGTCSISLIVAAPFLDMCLDIFRAWINPQKSFDWYIMLEDRAFFAKKVFFNTKTFLCHGPNIHHQAFFIN